MRPVIVVLLGAGCLAPELERTTDFAGLGPIELELTLGSQPFGIDVLHRRGPTPCLVLGEDFRGDISGAALSTYAGGVVEHCHSPTTSQPCTPAPSTCEMPFLGGGDVPIPVEGMLTIEDDSRIVRCDLGDAFVPRTITPVPAPSPAPTPGELVTLRWSPAADLARFELTIWQRNGAIPAPTFPYTIDGDLVTFELPPRLGPGTHTFILDAWADTPMQIKGCGEVPNRRFTTHSVEYVVER